MTHESFDTIELGQAEALIEFGMPVVEEEDPLKFTPAVPVYVEFE